LCAAKDYFCRKFLKSKGLKQNAVPLNVRALAGTGLLLLVVLSLLRVGFLLAFDPPAGSEPIPYVSTLWLGLRFDARAVSVACLFLLLSGFIPALNPYKSSFGRKLHMVLWFILLLSAGIFYAVDFANYAYLKERLNGGLLNYVADTYDLGNLSRGYHFNKYYGSYAGVDAAYSNHLPAQFPYAVSICEA
jgi:hypothetical protein